MNEALLANVTCVAVEGRGLLIEGPPGSGKSSLALALIDRGAVLVGDDGVTLERRGEALWALPPPNIAGKLEVRGVGIVEMACVEAPLAMVLRLDSEAPRMPEARTRSVLGVDLPVLAFRPGDAVQALRAGHALARFGRG